MVWGGGTKYSAMNGLGKGAFGVGPLVVCYCLLIKRVFPVKYLLPVKHSLLQLASISACAYCAYGILKANKLSLHQFVINDSCHGNT